MKKTGKFTLLVLLFLTISYIMKMKKVMNKEGNGSRRDCRFKNDFN